MTSDNRPKQEKSQRRDEEGTAQSDRQFPTQVSGGDENKGKPDGVSASPNNGANVQGKSDAGESGGGAYPNPHTGKKPTWGGFLGHGGQTNIGYHGSGQAGQDGKASPNSTTRGHDDYSDQGDPDGKKT